LDAARQISAHQVPAIIHAAESRKLAVFQRDRLQLGEQRFSGADLVGRLGRQYADHDENNAERSHLLAVTNKDNLALVKKCIKVHDHGNSRSGVV
jgi:hypothetical protein